MASIGLAAIAVPANLPNPNSPASLTASPLVCGKYTGCFLDVTVTYSSGDELVFQNAVKAVEGIFPSSELASPCHIAETMPC